MVARKWTDDDILEALKNADGNVGRAATALGTDERLVHARVAAIERRTGQALRPNSPNRVVISRDTRPNPITLQNGVIMVASDCHYWPDDVSTAHRAFVTLCKKLGPWAVVVNGDEFDGASISSHRRIGWEARPTVAAEIKAVQDRLQEIKRASPGAHLLGTYGNHTMRYDTYLSGSASALEGVHGMKYDDLVPAWKYAWAWMVNGHTLIKHRIKGGIHAGWNNLGDAQVSAITGHLHQLKITPRSTMSPVNNGRLYAVDSGMLADSWGPQFAYMEQGPRNWASGFAVLTFENGFLRPPELCEVLSEGVVWFRGNRIEV
jgi:hypothetical protein